MSTIFSIANAEITLFYSPFNSGLLLSSLNHIRCVIMLMEWADWQSTLAFWQEGLKLHRKEADKYLVCG